MPYRELAASAPLSDSATGSRPGLRPNPASALDPVRRRCVRGPVLALLLLAAPAVAWAVEVAWEPLGPERGCYSDIEPMADGRVLVKTCSGDFYVSDDDGRSWSREGAVPKGGWLAMELDPTDPETLYLANLEEVRRSTDLGRTWTTIGDTGPYLWGDFKDFLAAPGETGTVLYWARFFRYDGDHVSVTRDGGETWGRLGGGLPNHSVVDVEVAPSEPSVIYVVAGGNRPVYRSDDWGKTFSQIGRGLLTARSGAGVAVAPSRPNRVYTVLQGGEVFRSGNRGERWQATGAKLPVSGDSRIDLRVDPDDPDRLTAAVGGTWVSDDAGASFRRVEGCGRSENLGGGRLWRTCSAQFGVPDDGLWVSVDGGGTWHRRGFVTSKVHLDHLVVVPAEPARVVGLNQGELVEKRGDTPWQALSLPRHDPDLGSFRPTLLVPDPYDPDHWLVGAFEGVGETRDGGRTWDRFEVGCVAPHTIAFAPGPGDGVWVSGGFNLGACGRQPDQCGLYERQAGEPWTCRRGEPSAGPNNAGIVRVSPADADRVYLWSGLFRQDGDLWRSLDAGATWELLAPPAASVGSGAPVSTLAVHPFDADVLWAGLASGDVLLSRDGGQSWVRLSPTGGWPGEPRDSSEYDTTLATRIQELRVDPVAARHLYALWAGNLWALDGEAVEAGPAAGPAGWQLLSADLPSGVAAFDLDPADPATLYTALRSGGVWRLDRRLPTAACTPDEHTLCLGPGGRFRVGAARQDFQDHTGPARGLARTTQTGTFRFFDGDNTELVVKVLDGRPVNDRWWVFYASLSNVPYTLVVTDTETGESVGYYNPERRFASRGDTAAFPEGGPQVAAETALALPPQRSFVTPEPCIPSSTVLCLADGRFRVEADWEDFFGNVGEAMAIPDDASGGGFTDGADTGYLWFFAPGNYELAVKVIDGRELNGHWWVFYGSLSNVGYTLRVTDAASGEVLEYLNPEGSFGSRGDTRAFAAAF